jgi:hypothetical protein
VKSPGSQIGAAVPQSAFDTHATHFPSRARQKGALPGHSPFVWHWTHRWSDVSQNLASAGQSLAEVHPTQAPACVHTGALLGHGALLVHAAWHW